MGKGKEIEFHNGRSFSFFKPFLLCFWVYVTVAIQLGGGFPKFSCIADSTRCGCVCFCAPLFCVYSNIRQFCHVILVSIVNWCCLVRHGCKSCKLGYVNPSADLWTSSSYWTLVNIVNWILFFVFSHPSVAIPSILDDAGRNPLFPKFRRTTDVQQFVKDFCSGEFNFLLFNIIRGFI